MKKPITLKYIRKGKVIYNAEDESVHCIFKSINQAKKESHKLQMVNGGLGLGSLVAVK